MAVFVLAVCCLSVVPPIQVASAIRTCLRQFAVDWRDFACAALAKAMIQSMTQYTYIYIYVYIQQIHIYIYVYTNLYVHDDTKDITHTLHILSYNMAYTDVLLSCPMLGIYIYIYIQIRFGSTHLWKCMGTLSKFDSMYVNSIRGHADCACVRYSRATSPRLCSVQITDYCALHIFKPSGAKTLCVSCAILCIQRYPYITMSVYALSVCALSVCLDPDCMDFMGGES